MSTDAPQVPQISNAKRKRLLAQAFNAAQSQATHIACPYCKKGIWIRSKALTHTKKQWTINCPHCGKSILLTQQAKTA